MSFTCTFLSPLMVRFVAVKDSPKLDEPCVTDSFSMRSGSSTGTLYFGSPAELPYISAFVKTDLLFIHQLTCYQTGCHLLTYSPSVVSTHLTVSTNCHHYRGRPITTAVRRNFFEEGGGIRRIHLRTEDRRHGGLRAVAP